MLAFRRLIDEIDAPARLLAQTGGERSLTNLLHVGELLQQVATERRLHSAGLVHWLARALDDPKSARGELGQDADPIRLESDAGAVKLVTVHRSKGLEYPIVFLPFLAEGERPNDGIVRFHAHDGQLTLDIGSERRDAHAAIADDEGLAEASRLLYVALTRAKHQIVLFFGKFPRFGRSALSWLLFGRDCPSEGALDALEARVTAIPDFATPLEALGAGIRYGKLRTRRDPWSPPVVAPPPLAEFRPLRMQFRPWRVGSFSSLVAGSEHDPADGRDHDAAGRAASARDGDGPASPLLGWPRGAAPGTVLHGVLEALDFQAPPEARLATVAACLRRLGGPAGWDERLATALEVVCATPLGVGEPRLVDLDRAARRDELAFIIPAATEIDPSRLARCFEDHATSPHVRAYARRVGALGFPELRGFLKGYVDLVYRWDGRYGVVDYKSNHLGDRLDHYGCAALTEAMHHHDYVLQYHLYLLALHRQLRLRLPGYDFDRHVIGARYLFLRGMGGAPGAGVYADAPPRALIEALDACFEGA